MNFGDYLNSFLHVAAKNDLAVAAWKMPNNTGQKIIMGACTGIDADIFSYNSRGFVMAPFDNNLPGKNIFIKELASYETRNEKITYDDTIHPDLLHDLHKCQYDGIKYKLNNLQNQIGQSSTSKKIYTGQVDSVIKEIKQNNIQKLIVSGRKFIPLESGFDFNIVWNQLCYNYPEAFVSLVFLPGDELWMGVSPELLISTEGNNIRTVALAGTLNGTPGKSVEWNSKNKHEQQIVTNYIEECFINAGIENYEISDTKTIYTGKLKHLQTSFVAPKISNISKISPLLSLLHPSPAICGTPRDKARQLIQELEDSSRDYYAGYLGPVGYQNCMNLFVNLRCMQVGQAGARLYAGAGIVEHSNPEEEWREIQLKFDTLLDVVLPFCLDS